MISVILVVIKVIKLINQSLVFGMWISLLSTESTSFVIWCNKYIIKSKDSQLSLRIYVLLPWCKWRHRCSMTALVAEFRGKRYRTILHLYQTIWTELIGTFSPRDSRIEQAWDNWYKWRWTKCLRSADDAIWVQSVHYVNRRSTWEQNSVHPVSMF